MSPSSKNSLIVASVSTIAAAATGYWTVKKVLEKINEPKTKVFATKDIVAKNLCEYIVSMAKERIAASGVFYLAVAGGSLLDLLPGLADYTDEVDFSKVVLCFANHKCVATTDPKATVAKSQSKFAKAVGIKTIIAPIPDKPVPGSDGKVEAAFYSQALKDAGVPHSFVGGYPVMDLILLGLGADGHVGSCHPLGPAVAETKSGVAASPKSGEPSSITFTIETMNCARQVAVIACGGSKGKKEAVCRALQRPTEGPRGTFPAQLLKGPIFFLDAGAASDLQSL